MCSQSVPPPSLYCPPARGSGLEAQLQHEAGLRSGLEADVARLEAELANLRSEATLHAEGTANLGYLKHVLLALLEANPGQDEGPLLQVVFVFLQFSDEEVARVITARTANGNAGGRGGGGISRRLSTALFGS